MLTTSSPLTDPFERRREPPSGREVVIRSERGGAPYWLVVLLAVALGGVAAGAAVYVSSGRATTSNVEVKPTNDVLVAIKDLSRLECTEVQVEKVVDLSDRQNVFGLLETEDALLLVAAGSAILGVDLDKMQPGDASFNEETRTARLRLPPPELLSSRLDPDNTYVYRRETGVLAKRNEQLETRGRKEAINAVERAAKTPEAMERAKRQAERQLTALLLQLGAKKVEITWR